MKKILLIFIILLPIAAKTQIISTSLSQKFEGREIWINMVKTAGGFVRFDFIGAGTSADDPNVPALRVAGGDHETVGIELTQYDSLMNETKRVKLSDGERKYRRRLAKIVSMNGKVFFLYQLAGKKLMDIMAVEVNPVDLTVGSPKIIANTSQADPKSDLFDLRNALLSYLAISPGEKMLSLLIPAREYYWCSVINDNMDIVAEKKIDINSKHDNYYENHVVDDKGNVYAALRVYPPKKEQKEIRVFDVNAGVKNFPVDLGESSGKKISILLSRNSNTLLFAGSYNNTLDVANMLGTFTGALNLDNFKYILQPLSPFPDSMVNSLEKDGWAKTGRKSHGLHYEYFQQIFESDDGSLQMMTRLEKSPFLTGKNYTVYGPILYIHFGAVNNYGTIPMYRPSNAWGAIGGVYKAIPYKNKMIVFYNDNPGNVNRDPEKRIQSSGDASDCVLVAATIEQNATIQKNIISDLREDSFIAVLETVNFIGPYHLLIPLQKVGDAGAMKRTMRWMKVSIK